jgi:acetylornithine deacetylase/succinyl-diaminopimelate desuccinylase-like protein
MTNPVELVNKDRLIELTKALVSIRSVTGEEHELSDWTYEHFKSLGLRGVQRLPVEDSGDSIVGWIDGPTNRPAMMLNFHLDTFEAFAGWETDPFTPALEGGRLYGVGAHDMKGGGACVLGAVEALLQSGVELGGRLIVSATTDEENWSRGAHALIKSGLLDNCQYCLVPEPTRSGQLTIGQRGRHVFHLTFHGKTIHAAYRVGGINAVVDAAKVAAAIAGLNWKKLGYNKEFDMTGSICVIGLHGGSTIILVPELAHLYIDRHILPGQTVEEAADQIRAAVKGANIESRYELAWDERPTPAPGSFVVPADSRLVQTVRANMERELGHEVKFVLGRSVADTNHFAVYGGVPTLIYGPQGGNTCEANEYVLVDSMPAVARVYTQSVLDLLAGN